MIDPNDHDRFVLRQRVKLVINQYQFSIPQPGESDGKSFCFVEQARFKFKEDIRFFADDSKSHELMRILARQRFDPRARYDVTAPDGSKVGEIQKVFGTSLPRSTYALYGRDGAEVAKVRERSMPVALFRRLIGLIPYVESDMALMDARRSTSPPPPIWRRSPTSRSRSVGSVSTATPCMSSGIRPAPIASPATASRRPVRRSRRTAASSSTSPPAD